MAATNTEIRDQYFSEDEAIAALPRPVSKVTFRRWRKLKIGPPVTWLGRFPVYSKTSLLKWLEKRERAS